MKVLLIKDVYKLGRAGDVKRVADGYGRNFLIPQGLAVLATEGALKQSEYIREKAAERRATLNEELSSVAEQLEKVVLSFAVKAGDTGKLYGSITSQDIVAALEEKTGISVKRQQVDTQPLRTLGEFMTPIRLTMDLVPEIQVIVHREGEAVQQAKAEEVAEEQAPVVEPEAAPEPVESSETEVSEPEPAETEE